jgi:aubergine-like protein
MNTLRQLPIQTPSKLKAGRWLFVYDARSYELANMVFDSLRKSSVSLGLVVEEPQWIELKNFNDTDAFEKELDHYLRNVGEPSIAVILLSYEKYYKILKNICYKRNIVSQCLAMKTAKKMNLSVATNVLRQINSKLGGDLFHLRFSDQLLPNTMLIGIDVCHSGPTSIVGFCASINKQLSQYYSEKINQKRGQEIVDKQLKDALKRALGCFEERHKDYPDHFILYRDGVGDAMRRQVLQKEITQIKEAINETYNLAKKKPYITVIIVNKRITQRFFVEGANGDLQNPPSGCLINEKIVENQDSDIEYDFYLVPQFTTQGCVLPTHFYVATNDSPLKKDVIEKLTFDLCHYYFNWAGPIKVPAPCMYAHKIAELYMNIGKDAPTKHFNSKVYETFHYL